MRGFTSVDDLMDDLDSLNSYDFYVRSEVVSLRIEFGGHYE